MTLSSSLTTLLVQNDLSLKLPTIIQSFLHLRGEGLAGLAAVQEVTHAALLHQLASVEAGQFTEAIGAVDDGKDGLDLGVPQDKVTVWWEETWEGKRGKRQDSIHDIVSEDKQNKTVISSTLIRQETLFWIVSLIVEKPNIELSLSPSAVV